MCIIYLFDRGVFKNHRYKILLVTLTLGIENKIITWTLNANVHKVFLKKKDSFNIQK